jgi:SAM-dependent methyltransferase
MRPENETALSIETNLLVNKQYYDKFYAQVRIQDIVSQAQHYKEFLDDAIQTDTSWHGMYQNGFRNRLAGKSVLELGAGNGLNAAMMALLGAEVIACDISDVTATIVTEINQQLGTTIQPITGDFSRMEFEPASFDFIVGKAFLHHLTHDLESEYLKRVAALLKPDGEARFFEPAENSEFLENIRWAVPVPGRPSILDKKAFQQWKEKDPHPERDHSSQHYQQAGSLYFDETHIVVMGSIERLCRLVPPGKFNREFRRWAHRVELKLPDWFRYAAARSQLVVFQKPHH